MDNQMCSLTSLWVIWSRQWTVVSPGLQRTLNLGKRSICLKAGCHSEWSRQAGGMGQWEPHKIQQGQTPSPEAGKEGLLAALQAGGCLPGWEADLQKRPGHSSRQWHEPAACPGSQESQQHPGQYNRATADRLREGVIHLYSALMRTHLNTASSFGLLMPDRH